MQRKSEKSEGAGREYWTNGVDAFPGPVAQFRMAQLIDLDDRLYEKARMVYRFIIGWYHDKHGDALLSMNRVCDEMRARSPNGKTSLTRSAVDRAITALIKNGWIVCTFKGNGKGNASRYVPAFNVLELAAQGKFPEPSHANGTVEPSHANGTVLSHLNGTVDAEPSHLNGIKTRLPDSDGETRTGRSKELSAPPAAPGLSAVAPVAGFERVWAAYGKLGNKAKSRDAFAEIDIEEHPADSIAAKAASWCASAKPGTKRMPLEKWLAAEKYDEADRQPARAAQPHFEAANDDDDDDLPDDDADGGIRFGPSRTATNSGTIVAASLEGMVLTVRLDNGYERVIALEHNNHAVQAAGQAELAGLAEVLGRNVEEASDLMGLRVVASDYDDETATWRATEEAASITACLAP